MSSPTIPPIYSLHPFSIPVDISALTSLAAASFIDDLGQKAVLGSIDPQSEASLNWRRRRTEKELTSANAKKRAHYVKCVRMADGANCREEEMVAVAGWWEPEEPGYEERDKTEEEKKKEEGEDDNFPKGANKELCKRILRGVKEEAEKVLGKGWKDKYWCKLNFGCFLLL